MARLDANGSRTVTVTDDMGKILEKFKFDITGIRTVKGMFQGLWSLNPFSKAMSGNNGFSDVDAHTEIDGHSLILEFKQSLRGVNKGQVMKAIRQAKFQRTCTWFIEGETDQPKRMIAVNAVDVNGYVYISEVVDTDLETLKGKISAWESWARNNSLVKGNKTEEWSLVDKFIATCRDSR